AGCEVPGEDASDDDDLESIGMVSIGEGKEFTSGGFSSSF
ncbi:hypothetical protein A2U01_0041359, partial [Trifolium medium]|nr:hypothetical protein [Trifolium medium]